MPIHGIDQYFGHTGPSITDAPAKLFKVRLRPLVLTVKATCILTLLRSTCFCLMRRTESLSLFFSDISRIVVIRFCRCLADFIYQLNCFDWVTFAVSSNVPIYFLYCANHFPLLTFYGQYVKTISYVIIKLLIFCSTLLDKGVIVRPIAT